MKTLFVNRKTVVSILTTMLLIYWVQGISYVQGDTPTVTPGETNTSLKVSFTDFFYEYDENAYQIQLRRKSPQGDWITKCEIISLEVREIYSRPAGNYLISVSFTDLEPGVTYEARYRDTNLSECHENPPAPEPWSAITEGMTHLVPPPRVEFVDATLARAVRKALGLDTQGEHIELLQIPEAELPKLTALQYSSNDERNPPNFRSKIVNLTGLEHATQLTTLSLQENNISDLTPLAQLTQLTKLYLSENNISDLTPLAQLTQLTTLYLEDNQIIVITPLAQLTQLTKLSLGGFDGNEVSNISPLGQLTQLTELNLKDNNISDLTPLAQLTLLTELDLPENNISDVTPLTQLTLLTELDLGHNNISDVTPLAQLTQLKWLYLWFNNISDVTPLAQLINLQFLFLSYNDISDFTPLAQLPQRTSIHAVELFRGGFQPSDIELMTVSKPQPLTSATLNGSSVTLTLLPSGAAYDTSIENIRNALTLTGIDGVTVSDVIRVSDTELKVTFGFTGSLENTTMLTISLGAEAVTGYEGRAFTGEIPVYPDFSDLGLTVTSNYPLSAATLNGSVVTLTLSSAAFGLRTDISRALTISGITGITFYYTDIKHVSATVVTIELTFEGNIETDTILTFTLGADAIKDYYGTALTAEIPVSASTEVEVTGELVASTAFPLTKETLDGSIVKLKLKNHSYEGTSHDYDEPTIVVSGIPNVNTAQNASGTYLYFLSSTEISVRLSFSGNLENDATLTFAVPPSVIKDYYGPPLAATLPVTVRTGQQVLVPESQRPSMYWINTDTDKIESLEPFDAVTQEVVSLTVDAAGGKIYWAEQGSSRGTIKRANLDGTNVEVLTTEPITASSFVVDTADNKLYWTDSTQGRIHSANLNGENITTIVELDDIKDIAVDTEGGKLYFSDTFTIRRVNLDGTNSETVLARSGTYQTTYISGIAVADGKIYWTQQLVWWRTSGNIHRANLNGTNLETIATSLGEPTGIAVDTVNGKVYWANSYGGIQRMDINGGEVENVVYGIAAPGDFALGAVSTQPTTPSTPELPTTDAVVSLSPVSVASPAIGQQIEFMLNITESEAVAGYQATVQFDTTALRYVSGANGDFLPAGAFFVQPVVEGNLVKLNAASLAGESNGDGRLATLTFEVIAVKASTLTLSDVLLSNSAGESAVPQVENAQITEPTGLKGDINEDGVVNIQDLVLVAGQFGQSGQNNADVNKDGVVNIQDLVLVAGAFGNTAAAPALRSQALAMLNAADVQGWLTQAHGLNLTDAASQRGIIFLEQLLSSLIPKETALLHNYPNPFNPETWIPYRLAKDAEVTLHIYAVNGTLIRRLALGHQPAGLYQNRSRAAHWDGRNEFGEPVASGVYFYTLTAGEFTATRKMLITK